MGIRFSNPCPVPF